MISYIYPLCIDIIDAKFFFFCQVQRFKQALMKADGMIKDIIECSKKWIELYEPYFSDTFNAVFYFLIFYSQSTSFVRNIGARTGSQKGYVRTHIRRKILITLLLIRAVFHNFHYLHEKKSNFRRPTYLYLPSAFNLGSFPSLAPNTCKPQNLCVSPAPLSRYQALPRYALSRSSVLCSLTRFARHCRYGLSWNLMLLKVHVYFLLVYKSSN